MNEQEKIEMIRALFENLNARNYEASSPYIADGFMATAPGWPGPLTRDQVIDTFKANFMAFPDLRYELQDVMVQGDKAAATWELSGTHQGEWVTSSGQRIPPTNKAVRVRVSTIYDFSGGQIVRQESFFDQISLLSQLGLLEGTGQGA